MLANPRDVLVLPFFPHNENKQEGEARYAIVLEDLGNEWLLLGITSQVHHLQHYPDGFIITKNSADGKQMGLIYDSLICCGVEGVRKTFTMNKKFLTIPPIQKKGTCSEVLLDKILHLCP